MIPDYLLVLLGSESCWQVFWEKDIIGWTILYYIAHVSLGQYANEPHFPCLGGIFFSSCRRSCEG